jgi:glycosyltransferase involved in cell wall biosynthesis
LDLDDVESSTRLRIADLEERNGAMVEAARVRREARAYERMERKYLGRFSRVYVCSATDRDRLKRWGFGSRILPNTVAVPDPMTRRPVDGLFRFGFIGSLGYSPNRDAVFRLCRDIWPALRQEGGCELVVAGHAPDPEIRSLVERTPGAVLQGNVARSGDFMARCQALLVPLRAGGGTRLKLLEAFAAGCPVVCTGLGAEGLELEDGVEFLRAETDGDFVHQAVRLKKDPGLADALAGAAFRLVRERNGPQALALALGES